MLQKLTSNKGKIMLSAVILFITICLVIFISTTFAGDKIHKGILIDGIDVSGLNKDRAKELVNSNLIKLYSSRKIRLNYDGSFWEYSFKDLGIKFMTSASVNEAYNIGRTGNVFQRFYKIVNLKFNKCGININITFNKQNVIDALKTIKTVVDRQEKDAFLNYKNGEILFEDEVNGKSLDVDKNLNLITENFSNKNFSPVDLFVDDKEPKIRVSDIKGINGIIGQYSTKFNTADVNRSYNIRLASNKINGILLMPDENFSMNKILGPRTVKNGYKEAPVIFKNELVKGAGGGVCQVTTTLYNSVLISKLKVLERTHHSMPLSYVDKGLDATIAENYIDFKFANNLDYPVYISSWVEGNKVKVVILGKNADNGNRVVLKSNIIEEYTPQGEEIEFDSNVPENERIVTREPKKGYKVVVYRETYDNSNKLLKREKISEDIYAPIKAKVKVKEQNAATGAFNMTDY
ncbi:MAG: VanW family protein [Bacillota bacterium]|nr:VanW family protein [Bacillota bacterium]